jgi:hypothetical protein
MPISNPMSISASAVSEARLLRPPPTRRPETSTLADLGLRKCVDERFGRCGEGREWEETKAEKDSV